ncbi:MULTISPECIES: RES family NAD+ phosphorylase [unclassified Polaromonas]|uniref:RES family NAD+ phosphorylase n=1 Tax=unclassified Polaromonas TaxID=2638319 RepID=UPI000F094519|nr:MULTISPECIES: RES family NAD+ phosphorylase [unclassified Polaromonas]AYQ27471.1 RES domain-containing protein [Polaromonas sp. SP1]QGJ17689.1 RES domain-containing protein [Polaromonas sp. Pch-P]
MSARQSDGSDHALCSECAEDLFLKKHIEEEGEKLTCSECGEDTHPALDVDALAAFIEPHMMEHFQQGVSYGHEEQSGDPMSYAVQEVLGQYVSFEDELVEAVVRSEDYDPRDGDSPFWDDTSNYVPTRVGTGHLHAKWQYTLQELKHTRRFFSTEAQELFTWLFSSVDDLKSFDDNGSVVSELPMGTQLFRARVCGGGDLLKQMYSEPLKHVGPPPDQAARAGRMNAEGVSVLYGALDFETCLAEMRPAIANELVVITLTTTRPLRVLDFSRLDRARSGKALSYFQPDFSDEVERALFLRQLHRLIAQPIVPGHESDYLITQTMAEFLAHVVKNPFDGILFKSTQKNEGVNLVIFPQKKDWLDPTTQQKFGIDYVEDSIKLYKTQSVAYIHSEVSVFLDSGDVYKYDDHDDVDLEDY